MLIPHIEEPRWSVAYRLVGRVGLHHVIEGTGLIHTGRSAAGGNNVLIVLKSRQSARINGHQVDQQSAVVLGPRTEICLAMCGRCEWASITLPADVANECVPRSCHAALQSAGCRIVPVPRPWWEALTAAMDHADGGRRRAAATEDALLRALAPVLVGACQPQNRPAGRRSLSRDLLVRLAVMCIERQAGFRIRIDTLAAAVAISRHPPEPLPGVLRHRPAALHAPPPAPRHPRPPPPLHPPDRHLRRRPVQRLGTRPPRQRLPRGLRRVPLRHPRPPRSPAALAHRPKPPAWRSSSDRLPPKTPRSNTLESLPGENAPPTFHWHPDAKAVLWPQSAELRS